MLLACTCSDAYEYSRVPNVTDRPVFSIVGYCKFDLGIVKYHFELGAGKENFEWM